MTQEALKLALEALESAVRYHGIVLMSDPPQDAWKYHKVEDKADKAITAIKEALAQTEHNFCPRCGKRNKDIHTCTPPQD
jgi:ribosomal protein S27AE